MCATGLTQFCSLTSKFNFDCQFVLLFCSVCASGLVTVVQSIGSIQICSNAVCSSGLSYLQSNLCVCVCKGPS